MIECEVSDGATAETTAEQLKQLMRTSGTIVCNTNSNGIDMRLSSGSLHHTGNNGPAPAPPSSSSSSSGHGQLVSANSFEMNPGGCGGGGGTSLSEDSGLPYTNSSVSSGDSIRCIGMLKLEMELTESEGEVSQFDSLDNCSDGGMSAENFNTLKKGPLAPIEPPPQFQDSPQTTLLRSPILQSFAMRLTRTLLKTAMQQYLVQQLQQPQQPKQQQPPSILPTAIAAPTIDEMPPTPSPVRLLYGIPSSHQQHHNQHHHHHHHHQHHHSHRHQPHHHSSLALYTEPAGSTTRSSSSASSAENIYDVPNVDSDDPTATGSAVAVSTPHLPSVCTPPLLETSAATPPLRRSGAVASACEIYDYDLYYRKKEEQQTVDAAAAATATTTSSSSSSHNHHHHHHHARHHNHHHHTNSSSGGSGSWTHHHLDTVQRKKNVLYSPRHYPPTGGSNLSTANRPNSRNSLSSQRLSSSHNSLSVPTTNKADDSIFITQAMSHDTLTGREINDFYNVPIDSDIYSLPVDVVHKQQQPSASVSGGRRASSLLPLPPVPPSAQPPASSNGVATTTAAAKLRCSSRTANKKRRKSRAAPQPPAAAELVLGVSDFNKYGHGTGNSQKVKALRTSAAVAAAEVKRYSVPENVCEPMHMSLDEVKRFYHSLYSSSSDGGGSDGAVDGATAATGAATTSGHKQNGGGHKHRTAAVIAATAVVHNNNICHNNNNNNNNITPGVDGKTTTAALSNRLAVSSSAPQTATTTATSTPVTAASTPSAGGQQQLTMHASKSGGTPKKNYSKHHRKSRGDASSATTSPVIATIDGSVATPAMTNAAAIGCTSSSATEKYGCAGKRSQFSISMNLKQKFCSIFRFRRSGTAHITGGAAGAAAAAHSGEYGHHRLNGGVTTTAAATTTEKKSKGTRNTRFLTRALPPLPKRNDPSESDASAANADEGAVAGGKDERKPEESSTMDFAANIEKVKEYGWYWGPISSEAAEKILSNEPDGSFIVRDSSDDHYIFSLTFKLNNTVRHVRIEQDQGTFSFGSCAKFKSHTIMEFIENAVESSRSGRYLFFFHRRPEHGPMRVQLTNPVSRFKHIQSLQHMCRFVIRRTVVRKDLIQTLPLPRRLLDYLGYKNCFSEQVESDSSQTADEEINNVVSTASPIVAATEPIVDDDTAL